MLTLSLIGVDLFPRPLTGEAFHAARETPNARREIDGDLGTIAVNGLPALPSDWEIPRPGACGIGQYPGRQTRVRKAICRLVLVMDRRIVRGLPPATDPDDPRQPPSARGVRGVHKRPTAQCRSRSDRINGLETRAVNHVLR